MLKKSVFFDLLNHRKNIDFENFLSSSTEDEHYINWNQFVLPHDYGDAEAEYRAIRNRCAMFDVSPIHKHQIRGAEADAFLDHLLTRPVSTLPSMRGIYVAYCNDDGSLKDDAMLYKYAADDYLLMPSEIDHMAYFESLRLHLKLNDVSIVECDDSLVGIAMQGPLSATVLHKMGFNEIEYLKPFEVRDYKLADGTVRVSRMGFTADLGYECWFRPELCLAFEESIHSVRESLGISIPGYGVAAMEACRLEGGFIVAGWDCATELDPDPGFERSPFELGLGWLVKLDAKDFVGKAALLAQKQHGFRFMLRGFAINDPRKPEDGAELYATVDNQDVLVGSINCSSWSWGLERMIGNASIKCQYTDLEQIWTVMGRERLQVKLSRGPHLNLKRRNQVPAFIAEKIAVK